MPDLRHGEAVEVSRIVASIAQEKRSHGESDAVCRQERTNSSATHCAIKNASQCQAALGGVKVRRQPADVGRLTSDSRSPARRSQAASCKADRGAQPESWPQVTSRIEFLSPTPQIEDWDPRSNVADRGLRAPRRKDASQCQAALGGVKVRRQPADVGRLTSDSCSPGRRSQAASCKADRGAQPESWPQVTSRIGVLDPTPQIVVCERRTVLNSGSDPACTGRLWERRCSPPDPPTSR